MPKVRRKGYFSTHYIKTSKVKAVMLGVEALAFIVSLFYLKISSWDLFLYILFAVSLMAFVFDKKLRDYLTGVRIPDCLHLIPVTAVFFIYGLAEAIAINFISYLAGILIFSSNQKREERHEAVKAAESIFIFLIVLALLLKLSFGQPVVKRLLTSVFIVLAFYVHLRWESYFDSTEKGYSLSSYSNHMLELAGPYYSGLVLMLIIVYMTKDPVVALGALLVMILFSLALMTFIRNRNENAMVIEEISATAIKNEQEFEARRLSVYYGRQMAHNLNISGKDFDSLIYSIFLHDLGRAGLDVYSVDSIIEDIKSSFGEPLHAERISLLSQYVPALSDSSEILRVHHSYQDRELFSRSRRNLKILSSIVYVATYFAELLAFRENEIYTEREAFKDLKKDSGWDFEPKALRALKIALEKQGFKRL